MRQQQIVEALVKQLMLPANWGRVPAVVNVIQTEVDTNLTLYDILSLLPAVVWAGLDGDAVDHRVTEGNMVKGFQTDAGASVLDPQWDLIRPVIAEMFLK
jgi:hypothetical protein